MNSRQRRIEKSNQAQNGVRLLVKLLILLVVVLAVVSSIIFISRWVKTMLIGTEIVRAGELDDYSRLSCVVLNKENVWYAPSRGRFENLLLEGERIRRGTLIGYYYPDGTGSKLKIRADRSGIVCYHPDSLVKQLSLIDQNNVNSGIFKYEPRVINDGCFHFEKGQPVLRIIDNLVPTNLVARYSAARPVKTGEIFTVKYRGQDIGKATCRTIRITKAGRILFLSMDKFSSSLMEKRKPLLNFVSESYQGVIVPRKSLVKRDQDWGVYCLVNETVEFESVRVLYNREDKSVVDGLSDGDCIITTPGLVKEGYAF